MADYGSELGAVKSDSRCYADIHWPTGRWAALRIIRTVSPGGSVRVRAYMLGAADPSCSASATMMPSGPRVSNDFRFAEITILRADRSNLGPVYDVLVHERTAAFMKCDAHLLLSTVQRLDRDRRARIALPAGRELLLNGGWIPRN